MIPRNHLILESSWLWPSCSGWLSNVKRLEAGVTPLTFRFMCVVDGSSPERLGHVDPARVSAREELFSLVLKNSLVDLKVCKLFP